MREAFLPVVQLTLPTVQKKREGGLPFSLGAILALTQRIRMLGLCQTLKIAH